MQLSVQEYADSIGKSKMTVYRWIKERKIPQGVKVKNCCGIVKIYVKDKRVGQTGASGLHEIKR